MKSWSWANNKENSPLSMVPLAQANLCLDCEMITAARGLCRACGSTALMSVSRALSRPGVGSTGGAGRATAKLVSGQSQRPHMIFSRPVRKTTEATGTECSYGG
ncbi:MAG TPA: hypothetical protein VLV49_18110 [Terriglobales bacterium]|nr:hypothetical protein [Terriglobales bacterium]